MIKFIEYKDKKYPVRVSYYALTKAQAETGQSFAQTLQSGDITVYEPILFYGLESGARFQGDTFTLTRDDVVEILDRDMMGILGIINSFFPSEEDVKGKKAGPGNRKQKRAAGTPDVK